MKSLRVISGLFLVIGSASLAIAQFPDYDQAHAVNLNPPSYTTSNTGIGTNSKNAGGAAPSATPDQNTVEGDDALYHGKTSESEIPMLRDEGRLHFKTHGKEKIQEIDSLKKLQSSGADSKFEGSLLHSSVTSIEDVNGKANDAREPAEDGDPRFKTGQLVFKLGQDEQPAKTNSTPSPTPSPSASPQKKDSGRTNP